MQVQDLKRWHWAVAALVVGLALSYVWSSVEWGDTLPTIGQQDFERGLVLKYPQPSHISGVIVLPPEEGKYKVVCEQLRRTKDPKVMEFRPVAFMADAPYKAGEWRGASETYPNVREFLAKTKQANPTVKYRYAWYRETWAVFMLWTGASMLLIGGVWPSVVSLMTGGGLGLTPMPKEAKYDLERFGKGQDPTKPIVARPATTQAEMDELAALDKELEQKLAAGGGTVSSGEAAAVGTAQGQDVRKLTGGPVEEVKAQQDDLEKEYGGEFYPVVRSTHVKKKDDEEHPPKK
jgi:hypothetical protein